MASGSVAAQRPGRFVVFRSHVSGIASFLVVTGSHFGGTMITSRFHLTGSVAKTLAAMLAVIALPVSSFSLRAQGRSSDPATPELVLLDLRIGDVASATLQGQRIGNSILLPARDVCTLAELPCQRVPEGSYVSLDSTAALLHARVNLDWAQLMVLVTECDELPVVRRYVRAVAREALFARRRVEPTQPDDFVARSPAGFSPVVRLQYGMTAASSSLSAATHAVTLGTAAFRGALRVQLALARSPASGFALRPTVHGASWVRAWRSPGPIRQLRLGDIAMRGGVGMVRGASITNAPYDGSGGVDSVLVTGVTLPGRELDAYRDGTLVASAYATADGSYSFWLPSTYGANSFTVASYDLSDRPLYTRRAILIEQGMLSPGSFRYALTGGHCRVDLCRAAADLDVSYAPLDRLTASASINAVNHKDRGASVGLDTRVFARITDAVTASVTRKETGETSATAHFVPVATLDVLGTYRYGGSMARTDAPRESGFRPISQSDAGLSASWQPHLPRSRPNLTAQLTSLRSETRSNTAVRFSLGLPLRIGYVAPFTRYTHRCEGALDLQTVSIGTDALISPTRAPSVLGRSLLRLSMETTSSSARARSSFGLNTASAAISIPVLGTLRLDAQAAWTGAHRPIVSLAARELIRGFRIANSVSRSSTGKALALHTIDGSVLIDGRRRRIATGHAAVLGGASITGTVFIDLNRNNRFDPGEQPVPGAYIRAGDGGALSDATGEYELRDVEPYAAMVIQVDPLTLPRASLTPLHRTIRAETVPDQLLRINIAIVEDALTASAVAALNEPR